MPVVHLEFKFRVQNSTLGGVRYFLFATSAHPALGQKAGTWVRKKSV